MDISRTSAQTYAAPPPLDATRGNLEALNGNQGDQAPPYR
jgi:hypothetical protein